MRNSMKVLVAALVLGTSAIASAAPCEPAPAKPVWTTRPMPFHRPITVANDTQFAKDGRTFITVGADRGTFDKLTIKAEHGRTFVKQVYVQFADGSEKVLRNVDMTLNPGQSIDLSLAGQREGIKRLVVYGTNTPLGIVYQPAVFDVTLV